MTTRTENIDIEDITLTGDQDISVPRQIESITVESDRLNQHQVEALLEVYRPRGHFCFVGTCRGLGIAIENECGYYEVICYSSVDFDANVDYAMELNQEYLAIDEKEAMALIATTMREA